MKQIGFFQSKIQSNALICYGFSQFELASYFPQFSSATPFFSKHDLSWDDIYTPWLAEFFLQRFGIGESSTPLSPELCSFAIMLTKESELIVGRNHFRIKPRLECVTCTEEFSPVLEGNETAYFCLSSPAAKKHSEHQLNERELASYDLVGNKIVLDEFLLDSLEASIPINPKCHANCKGLCSDCGENLNQIQSCQNKSIDTCRYFGKTALN